MWDACCFMPRCWRWSCKIKLLNSASSHQSSMHTVIYWKWIKKKGLTYIFCHTGYLQSHLSFKCFVRIVLQIFEAVRHFFCFYILRVVHFNITLFPSILFIFSVQKLQQNPTTFWKINTSEMMHDAVVIGKNKLHLLLVPDSMFWNDFGEPPHLFENSFYASPPVVFIQPLFVPAFHASPLHLVTLLICSLWLDCSQMTHNSNWNESTTTSIPVT